MSACPLHGETKAKGCPACEDDVQVVDATGGVTGHGSLETLAIEAFELDGQPDYVVIAKTAFGVLTAHTTFQAAALSVWAEIHPDEVDDVIAEVERRIPSIVPGDVDEA